MPKGAAKGKTPVPAPVAVKPAKAADKPAPAKKPAKPMKNAKGKKK
jgi:hypothetical protein